jgi:hypothetical protein
MTCLQPNPSTGFGRPVFPSGSVLDAPSVEPAVEGDPGCAEKMLTRRLAILAGDISGGDRNG